MGLLTDPSAGQGKLTKALLKYYIKLAILLYIGGIGYFCSLASTQMNASTYFSENALLPGLAKSEFREDNAARTYLEELKDEMKKYDNSIPYPWLLAKMKQIGLDTYTHSFALNYPLGKKQKFTGKNVYGVLRAARAASTEALVVSVPYRPPVSVHATTAPSIAIMLAFAKFAIKEKYWAKDIIFLITEHEQLGMQAWLEAYHGVHAGTDGTLEQGDLRGRAGAIQAAINLELHDSTIGQVDIKIEGLNGQLPNLDLFNLAAKMLVKEGVHHTFKNRPNKLFRDSFKDWVYNFQTLMAMVATQATGTPNGNHGLYHRFGIQALTLEGYASRGAAKTTFLSVGRIIEGMFRSLNNLLERFHQSFFFYLLPSSERFISIGLYIPVICLIAGALFIKACANWCQIQENDDKKNRESQRKVGENIDPKNDSFGEFMKKVEAEFHTILECRYREERHSANFVTIFSVFLLAHVIGVFILNSPQLISSIASQYGYSTEFALSVGFVSISLALLPTPLLVPFRFSEKSMSILNILALLELGTVLICISMNNFSLGLFCSVIYVPLSLCIGVNHGKAVSLFTNIVWFAVHPLIVIFITVLVCIFNMYPEESANDNFFRSFTAMQQAIVFSIVDSMIYGHWLFSVITGILLPNWLCFWMVSFSSIKPMTPLEKKFQ